MDGLVYGDMDGLVYGDMGGLVYVYGNNIN